MTRTQAASPQKEYGYRAGELLVTAAGGTAGGGATLPLPNAGFEAPAVGAGPAAYQYNPAGGAWAFAGQSGVAGNNSGFTSGNPNAPEGDQVAFVQGQGAISQAVSGLQAGTNYTVTFLMAQRGHTLANGGQNFRVYLDGTPLQEVRPDRTSYEGWTVTFTATQGTHTLGFYGVNSSGGDNTAFIDDVRITAAAGGPETNLARNKQTDQSSTAAGGVHGRAVDGNTSGNYSDNSVTHTALQPRPWWEVDLGSVQQINTIKVWNRTDCCGGRLADFYVFVSDQPFASTDLNATINQPGVDEYYTAGPAGVTTAVAVNRTGRYVRVQLTGTNYLSLAEVEVLGGGGGGSPASVKWLVSDHLGTPRMVADQTGSMGGVTRHDYLPFGEELGAGVGGRTAAQGYVVDNVRQKFTGKERDNETDLDYFLARYHSPAQGRFTSPDPILITPERQLDPQSLNLYVYARNNPLAYTDPTGMERVRLGQHTDDEINKRLAEIDEALKREGITQQQTQRLQGERNTLLFEQEGNRVVTTMLQELDKIGARNGLKASDFTLFTDPVNDATALAKSVNKTLSADTIKTLSSDQTVAFFSRGVSDQIFVLRTSQNYVGVVSENGMNFIGRNKGIGRVGVPDLLVSGSTYLRHEQFHRDVGPSESSAYSLQLKVLNQFGPGAFANRQFYNFLRDGFSKAARGGK